MLYGFLLTFGEYKFLFKEINSYSILILQAIGFLQCVQQQIMSRVSSLVCHQK